MSIADDLCALKDAIHRLAITDQTTILKGLRKIDQDLRDWANPTLDAEYTFDPAIDSSSDADAVWQGVYHNYKNHFVCKSRMFTQLPKPMTEYCVPNRHDLLPSPQRSNVYWSTPV